MIGIGRWLLRNLAVFAITGINLFMSFLVASPLLLLRPLYGKGIELVWFFSAGYFFCRSERRFAPVIEATKEEGISAGFRQFRLASDAGRRRMEERRARRDGR